MDQNTNEQIATREAQVCATCGQLLHGPYCSHCGEKKLDKHDRKIVHIFEEFFHSLTHADSKFLRSIKYLLTRPGFLTSEYLSGRRKPYSSLLSLFFIANLLYLIYTPIDTFNSRFQIVIEGQPYSESLLPQVHNKMQQKQWTITQLEEHYNEKSSHEAKLLLIVFVFLVSLPVALLFISRKRYYYDYVIFAMEYVNFIMYALMLLIPYFLTVVIISVQLIRHKVTEVNVNAPLLSAFAVLLLWVYLTLAARRVFKQAWWLTIIKAAALVCCTIVAMFFYRFLAFEVTMFLL